MSKPKYDSTVARIAGNLLSGRRPNWEYNPDIGAVEVSLASEDWLAAQWAVAMAREIVAEVERTEPRRESQAALHPPQEAK